MGKQNNFGLGLALGALIGGAAAYFMSPQSGKENREMAKQKFEEFRKKIEGKKLDEIVKEVFGTVNDEGRKLYMRARDEINDRLDELQQSLSDIDREKYKTIVEDVMKRLQKEGDTTKDRVSRLQNYLISRFEMAHDEAKQDAKKVAKDVTNSTNGKH